MLNLRTVIGASLTCLLVVTMTGCNAKNTNKPQETYAKPLEMLSADGIGPINAQTPFNLHDITMAFQGLNVTQNSNFNSGKEYPTINVAKDIKTLLIINPDVKHEKIFSVMVKDNLIGNRLGHSIGTRYADIYAYDKTEECAPGTEELAGKVLCYAPKTGNILYLFSGQWNGDKNKVPPKETLANWTLEAMIWKPIQNK